MFERQPKARPFGPTTAPRNRRIRRALRSYECENELMTPVHADPECEFCKIVAGNDHAEVVYENSSVVAFFPLEPAGLGHTLVIPKHHVQFLWQLEDNLAAAVATGVTAVARALKEVLRPDGLNLINSSGSAATQTVFHLHMHLVPRWTGDHMGEIWPRDAHWSVEVEDRTAELVRGYFTNM